MIVTSNNLWMVNFMETIPCAGPHIEGTKYKLLVGLKGDYEENVPNEGVGGEGVDIC